MWHRKMVWSVFIPCVDRFCQVCFASLAQHVPLCVLANQQRESDVRHFFWPTPVPQLSAPFSRREVARFSCAGETKPHWNDCDYWFVAECLPCYGHPRSQTLTTQIGPGHARMWTLLPGACPIIKKSKRSYQPRESGVVRAATQKRILDTAASLKAEC